METFKGYRSRVHWRNKKETAANLSSSSSASLAWLLKAFCLSPSNLSSLKQQKTLSTARDFFPRLWLRQMCIINAVYFRNISSFKNERQKWQRLRQKKGERLEVFEGFTCRCSTHIDWAPWCPLRLSGWRAPACTGSLRTASPQPGAAETHQQLKDTFLLFPMVSGIVRGKSLSVKSLSHGFHSLPCCFAMGNVFIFLSPPPPPSYFL